MPWRKEKQDGSIEEEVPVLTRPMAASAQGYYEPATGIIAIRPGLDSHSRLLVLFQEWAHRLLHPTGIQEHRAQREWQAEATAYVVAQHFGLAHPFAAEYLTSWQATAPQLEGQLAAVMKAASHIIGAVECAEATGTEGRCVVDSPPVEEEPPADPAPTAASEGEVMVLTAEMIDGTLIAEEVDGFDAFIEMVLSYRRDPDVNTLTWQAGREVRIAA